MKLFQEGFEQGVWFAIQFLKTREENFSAEFKKFKAQIKFLEDFLEGEKIRCESETSLAEAQLNLI